MQAEGYITDLDPKNKIESTIYIYSRYDLHKGLALNMNYSIDLS